MALVVASLLAAGCTLGDPASARQMPAVVHARQVVAGLRSTVRHDRSEVRLARGSTDDAAVGVTGLAEARAKLRADRAELTSA
ncbi:MAG: hypothetical protein JO368_08430, partial [Acidimicrobiales bacterium]|nr:hypothetical protein [Acidimicrobiales bacterium]